MAETFTCGACGGVYKTTTTNEEARSEAEGRVIAPVPKDEAVVGVLCEDCFEEFSEWWNEVRSHD